MEKEQINTIRANIKRLMHDAGIPSENALATKAGVSQKTVNLLLANDTLPNPTAKVVTLLARCFHVSPWMLWVKDFPFDAIGPQPLNTITRSGYRLLKVFESLNDEERKAILNFAEFQISGSSPVQAKQIREARAQYTVKPVTYKTCGEDFS